MPLADPHPADANRPARRENRHPPHSIALYETVGPQDKLGPECEGCNRETNFFRRNEPIVGRFSHYWIDGRCSAGHEFRGELAVVNSGSGFPDDQSRKTQEVALAAIESPKNWFEDFGAEHLSNGVALIQLEPDYAQTINTKLEYHLFVTPNGDCKGLYVTRKTESSFEVHELGGGTSSQPRTERRSCGPCAHTQGPQTLLHFRLSRSTANRVPRDRSQARGW